MFEITILPITLANGESIPPGTVVHTTTHDETERVTVDTRDALEARHVVVSIPTSLAEASLVRIGPSLDPIWDEWDMMSSAVQRLTMLTAEDIPVVIAFAEYWDISLSREDFTTDGDGFLSLDGMPPGEWLDAMTMG